MLATITLSSIICLIAWGHLLFKFRRTSPYFFYPLLIGLLVFAFFNVFLFTNNNQEYWDFFPMAGLILGLIHLNYFVLSKHPHSSMILLGIFNSIGLLAC